MQNSLGISSFYQIQRQKLISAISTIKQRTRQQFIIIVADQQANTLFDHLFSVVDRAKMGIIHAIQKLETKRSNKKYPVIYLISPRIESVQMVVNDFKAGSKYESVDILSLGPMSNENLALLKGNGDVKKALKGFNQIMMDYIPWLDNAFTFEMKNSFLKMHTNNWIQTTARKLCSVLLSLERFSSFQIVYPEQLEPLAIRLQKHLESFYQVLKKYEFNSYSSTFPTTKVYLFPRQFDYQSPLMRSFDYLSLIHNILTVPSSQTKVKNIQIGYRDPILWQTKYMNLPEAIQVVQRLSVRQNSKVEERDFENNTYKAIKNIMDSNVMVGNIQGHLEIMKELSDSATNFQQITTLQQTVVNGVDEQGKKLTDKNIIKLIDAYFKKNIKMLEKDLLQFIALCYFSLSVKDEPSFTINNYVKQDSAKLLAGITKLDVVPTKLKQKPSTERYDLFRHEPRIVHFLRQVQFGSNVYKLKSRIAGEVEKLVRKIPKENHLSKTVVFVTGYIGINEIVALNRTNKNLVIGSNKIVNPWQYIWELVNLGDQSI